MAHTVLVIDDEPDINVYLTRILEEEGLDVMTAASVSAATKIIMKKIPDLVCLDIMMPQESGISFYRFIKKDGRLSHIPVLIISGIIREGDFDFRSYVPDESIPPPEAYLEKPIRVDQFLQIVKGLVSQRAKKAHPGKASNE